MITSHTLENVVRTALRLPEEAALLESHGPGTLPEWDSLGHLSLISALESSYKISISMEEMMALESLSDIRKLLIEKGISDH